MLNLTKILSKILPNKTDPKSKFDALTDLKYEVDDEEDGVMVIQRKIGSIFTDEWISDKGFFKGYPIKDKTLIKSGDLIEYRFAEDVLLPAIVKFDSVPIVQDQRSLANVQGRTSLAFDKVIYIKDEATDKFIFKTQECLIESYIDDITKVQRLKTILKSKTVWTTSIVGCLIIIDPFIALISSDEVTTILNTFNYTKLIEIVGVIVIMYERVKKLVKYNA